MIFVVGIVTKMHTWIPKIFTRIIILHSCKPKRRLHSYTKVVDVCLSVCPVKVNKWGLLPSFFVDIILCNGIFHDLKK